MSPTWRSLFFALHLPLGSVLHRIPVASRVYLISCSHRSGRGSRTDRSLPRFLYFCFLFVTLLTPADFAARASTWAAERCNLAQSWLRYADRRWGSMWAGLRRWGVAYIEPPEHRPLYLTRYIVGVSTNWLVCGLKPTFHIKIPLHSMSVPMLYVPKLTSAWRCLKLMSFMKMLCCCFHLENDQ